MPHQTPRSDGLPPTAQQGTEQEDLPLITQAQAGDREAFAVLVQRHGKAVFSLIDKMLRDRHAAEDLWQETFVRALENLTSYEPRLRADGTGPSFASWLYRIAANLTLDELRKRNRWKFLSWGPFTSRRTQDSEDVEEYDPPVEMPDALEALATKEDILRVRRALDALPPEWRMMLILREFQDLRYEEIAEIINAPIGTVRSRLARAREQLRVALLQHTAQRAAS